MEIKGTAAPVVPQTQPTESVQKSASVSGAQTIDAVVLGDKPSESVAALPPPAAPKVAFDQAARRGAACFATQLEEMGKPAKNGPDLMAAFLKLQVLQSDDERSYTKLLSEFKTNMADLAIHNAKAVEAVIGSFSLIAAAQRNICQQVNADVTRAGEELKKLLDETLMEELDDKEEDKEEKAVGEEELQRKFGKSSMADVGTVAGAQLSTAVTAEAGGVAGGELTMLSIDNIRPTVAGAISALASTNSSAAELLPHNPV